MLILVRYHTGLKVVVICYLKEDGQLCWYNPTTETEATCSEHYFRENTKAIQEGQHLPMSALEKFKTLKGNPKLSVVHKLSRLSGD